MTEAGRNVYLTYKCFEIDDKTFSCHRCLLYLSHRLPQRFFSFAHKHKDILAFSSPHSLIPSHLLLPAPYLSHFRRCFSLFIYVHIYSSVFLVLVLLSYPVPIFWPYNAIGVSIACSPTAFDESPPCWSLRPLQSSARIYHFTFLGTHLYTVPFHRKCTCFIIFCCHFNINGMCMHRIC